MSTRNAFVTIAFALSAAGVAADAGAQQRSEGPCAADVKKFCGDVKPGQGAIARCMRAHEAELSPACRDGAKAATDAESNEYGREDEREGVCRRAEQQ